MIAQNLILICLLALQFSPLIKGHENVEYDQCGDLRQGYFKHYYCTLQCFGDVLHLSFLYGNLCQGTVRFGANQNEPVPLPAIGQILECITVRCKSAIPPTVCGGDNGVIDKKDAVQNPKYPPEIQTDGATKEVPENPLYDDVNTEDNGGNKDSTKPDDTKDDSMKDTAIAESGTIDKNINKELDQSSSEENVDGDGDDGEYYDDLYDYYYYDYSDDVNNNKDDGGKNADKKTSSIDDALKEISADDSEMSADSEDDKTSDKLPTNDKILPNDDNSKADDSEKDSKEKGDSKERDDTKTKSDKKSKEDSPLDVTDDTLDKDDTLKQEDITESIKDESTIDKSVDDSTKNADDSVKQIDDSSVQKDKPSVQTDDSSLQTDESLLQKDDSGKEKDDSLELKDDSLKQKDSSLTKKVDKQKDKSSKKKHDSLKKKDDSLKQKGDSFEIKDGSLEKTDDLIEKKDVSLDKKDDLLEKKDVSLDKKDDLLEKKDVSSEKKDDVLKQKDDALKQKEKEVPVPVTNTKDSSDDSTDSFSPEGNTENSSSIEDSLQIEKSVEKSSIMSESPNNNDNSKQGDLETSETSKDVGEVVPPSKDKNDVNNPNDDEDEYDYYELIFGGDDDDDDYLPDSIKKNGGSSESSKKPDEDYQSDSSTFNLKYFDEIAEDYSQFNRNSNNRPPSNTEPNSFPFNINNKYGGSSAGSAANSKPNPETKQAKKDFTVDKTFNKNNYPPFNGQRPSGGNYPIFNGAGNLNNQNGNIRNPYQPPVPLKQQYNGGHNIVNLAIPPNTYAASSANAQTGFQNQPYISNPPVNQQPVNPPVYQHQLAPYPYSNNYNLGSQPGNQYLGPSGLPNHGTRGNNIQYQNSALPQNILTPYYNSNPNLKNQQAIPPNNMQVLKYASPNTPMQPPAINMRPLPPHLYSQLPFMNAQQAPPLVNQLTPLNANGQSMYQMSPWMGPVNNPQPLINNPVQAPLYQGQPLGKDKGLAFKNDNGNLEIELDDEEIDFDSQGRMKIIPST